VGTNGCKGLIAQSAQFAGIETRGLAEGIKQWPAVLLGPVAPGEGLEHLHRANGEEGVGLETPLVTEQMQFHQ
jgi:hypothetical protein